MRCHRAAPRLAAAVCVLLGLGFVSSAARADASFALSWRSRTGAPACVTDAAVREAVEKKLGRKPFTDRDRADILIEGEETVAGGRFRARVTQRDRHGVVLGSRDLDAQSCPSLIRTTTIVVALFIEPGNDGTPGEDRRASEDSVEGRAPGEDRVDAERREHAPDARPRGPLRPPPPSLPPAAWRRPLELSLGFGGAAAVGLLPSASASLRIIARLEHTRSRFSFEWSAGYSMPQTLRDGSVRGTFSAVDQQLRACLALFEEPRIEVDACGGVFWGAIVPDTKGVNEGNDAWRPLVGPVAAVALQLSEGLASARLDLGLTTPVVRRGFYYLSSDAEPERFYSTSSAILFVGLSGLFTIL